MDYPNVVKYPMDLGTVKENVKNSTYQHVEECLDDIQLIWDNCKSYNAEGSVKIKETTNNSLIFDFNKKI